MKKQLAIAAFDYWNWFFIPFCFIQFCFSEGKLNRAETKVYKWLVDALLDVDIHEL